MLWYRPPGHRAPRTHRLLLLHFDGRPHIADVGFGVVTLTSILSLDAQEEQPTPHEVHRLMPDDGGWRLEGRLGRQWQPLYRFDLYPWEPEDFEPVNYQLAHHPASSFVKSLAPARALPNGRLTLSGRDFTRRDEADGEADRRRLRDVDEMIDVIEREFGIACRSLPGIETRCADLFVPDP